MGGIDPRNNAISWSTSHGMTLNKFPDPYEFLESFIYSIIHKA
ncbi:hypothetical protein RAMDARK_1319 [Rickettsia amblyommatis str. Darkwater]|uniref:Uncharacterized protein n=1 Tax=Rickettsia amblyommatis str. Ac/Pa TaxID=1359164 RepID=A0A0F3N4P3_RICAM|nr:hypothetical protein APHACPA_1740 [Rickettsia amblyommatis str. Ac/Pa]KJV90837.1 hypothetical protein RAMDARK_1319 [Rickettsia amblyommatis str. Darkwater]